MSKTTAKHITRHALTGLMAPTIAALAAAALVGMGPGAAEPTGAITDSATVQPETGPVEIDEAAYASAKWPEHNDDLYAKDFQGKPLEVKLGDEIWITDQVDLTGKVVVLDFWATWCGPCVAAAPKLDALQKRYKKDLVVLGIGGQGEDEGTVRAYVQQHDHSYSQAFDAGQRVYRPFESKGIPLVVVLSTDGVVRWMGNPHEKEFNAAVARTVMADPMVRARKKKG